LTSTTVAPETLTVNTRAEELYVVWRERGRAIDELRDGQAPPPEKLLQAIWLHQRLKRDQLKTPEGRPIRVFHPGFASREGGPDFRGAILQIGDEKPVSGDVEIDLQAGGWRAHGHDKNPNFQKVVLHVLWAPPAKSAAVLPVLALSDLLDAPLADLAQALEHHAGLPENLRGKCAGPLRDLSTEQLSGLLRAAAKVRLRNKAAALLARARHAGWEGAFWEHLFRAIGYKHNTWPMQNLAESKVRWMRHSRPVFEIQSLLLGVSGLLPDELTRSQKGADSYLRRAWDLWWRERDAIADCRLPRAVWRFNGLRPANHPQRRLALAAHWLADQKLISKVEAWGTMPIRGSRSRAKAENSGPSARELMVSLLEMFQVNRDDFWSWHWTLKSTRLSKPQPLLGRARVTDLAVNVVLPWLWVRAREGGNQALQAEVERRFFAWPAAEDNSILKLARQRLLGTTDESLFKQAALQQGLLQIVSDFCDQSNAICADCRFPELVHGLNSPNNERA
jgi:hypothetical protein